MFYSLIIKMLQLLLSLVVIIVILVLLVVEKEGEVENKGKEVVVKGY